MPTQNPLETIMLDKFKELMIVNTHDTRYAFTVGVCEGIDGILGRVLNLPADTTLKDVHFEMHRMKLLLTSTAAGVAGAFDDEMRAVAHNQMKRLYAKYDKPLDDVFSPSKETQKPD